jgi:hypothetical protein
MGVIIGCGNWYSYLTDFFISITREGFPIVMFLGASSPYKVMPYLNVIQYVTLACKLWVCVLWEELKIKIQLHCGCYSRSFLWVSQDNWLYLSVDRVGFPKETFSFLMSPTRVFFLVLGVQHRRHFSAELWGQLGVFFFFLNAKFGYRCTNSDVKKALSWNHATQSLASSIKHASTRWSQIVIFNTKTGIHLVLWDGSLALQFPCEIITTVDWQQTCHMCSYRGYRDNNRRNKTFTLTHDFE